MASGYPCLGGKSRAALDLSWVSDPWWPLVTGQARRDELPDRVQRRHFEVCLFTQIMWTEVRRRRD